MNKMKPITARLLTVPYLWTILLFVSGLQTIGAKDIPSEDSELMNIPREDSEKLLEYFRTQERLQDEAAAASELHLGLEDEDFEDLERDIEYEDDLDYGPFPEDEVEDDTMTMKDVEDILQAREVLQEMDAEREGGLRNLVLPGSTNVVTKDARYYFYSHGDFGNTRYPNGINVRWTFVKPADMQYVKIYCPFFRTQWYSPKCKKDRFSIFKHPYKRGIRRCGQIHGFWKKYDKSIRVVFKTNWSVRRAGFCCAVSGIPYPKTYTYTSSTSTSTTSTATTSTTSSTTTTYAPGCPVAPVVPAMRQVVSDCSDILPGYSQCTCNDIFGGICIKCEICTACDMEFFADHDFSNVDLYVYIHFNCPEYPINAAALSFGFTATVKGYVVCFPSPSHVSLPAYPAAAEGIILAVVSCPLPDGMDICGIFEDEITGRRSLPGTSYLPTHKGEMLGGLHQKSTLQSLATLPAQTENLEIVGLVADLSTIPAPENMKHLTVIDTFCQMFPDGDAIDLTSFTSLETLKLELCVTSCPVSSISLNSNSIDTVTLIMPNTTSAAASCIDNQGTGLPNISIY